MSSYFDFDRQRYESRRSHSLRFLFLLRRCQESNNLIWRVLKSVYGRKYGLEISADTVIGPGLYLGHAYGISINPQAVIGCNVNIHKGVTIGQENRGARKGAPVIGDSVWIGANSVIVGNVTIGDDVLIAPLTFVNRDIPSHSIVLGNPCRVISKEWATEGYINRTVDATLFVDRKKEQF